MKSEEVIFTKEQLDRAASLEESERLSAEVDRLNQRVILLRALVIHLEALVPDPEATTVGEGIDPAPEEIEDHTAPDVPPEENPE